MWWRQSGRRDLQWKRGQFPCNSASGNTRQEVWAFYKYNTWNAFSLYIFFIYKLANYSINFIEQWPSVWGDSRSLTGERNPSYFSYKMERYWISDLQKHQVQNQVHTDICLWIQEGLLIWPCKISESYLIPCTQYLFSKCVWEFVCLGGGGANEQTNKNTKKMYPLWYWKKYELNLTWFNFIMFL